MGVEIEAGTKTFASGLLPELIVAVRRSRPGNLFTIIGSDSRLGEDLATWCRFTRNTLVETTKQANCTRWVIRCGEAPAESEADRPVGSQAVALHQLRLQFALRLLLRALLAKGAAAGTRP